MLAVGHPVNLVSVQGVCCGNHRLLDEVEVGHRAIVGKGKAAMFEGMCILERRRPDRRVAHVRDHHVGIASGRCLCEMLIVVGRPGLFFGVRQPPGDRLPPPTLGMGPARHILTAPLHQSVLGVHELAFDLAWLRRPKPVEAAHVVHLPLLAAMTVADSDQKFRASH